jgi:hypothetical protein
MWRCQKCGVTIFGSAASSAGGDLDLRISRMSSMYRDFARSRFIILYPDELEDSERNRQPRWCFCEDSFESDIFFDDALGGKPSPSSNKGPSFWWTSRGLLQRRKKAGSRLESRSKVSLLGSTSRKFVLLHELCYHKLMHML